MSVNISVLMGNIGKEIEFGTTPKGTSVAKFSVATSYVDYETKEKKTDWHNVVAYDKKADFLRQFTGKSAGAIVTVVGKSQTRKYEGKDGNTNYYTQIVAERVSIAPRETSRVEEYRGKEIIGASNQIKDTFDRVSTQTRFDEEDVPF